MLGDGCVVCVGVVVDGGVDVVGVGVVLVGFW